MHRNVIRLLIISFVFISNIGFMSFETLAVDTKEITIRYLDENGNVIKEDEKKQIEMGKENITKYVSSYKKIENGTNLFPPEILGYVVQLAKMKTYYKGIVREGMPDEICECELSYSNRIAITSPQREDLYIVEFIYKKDDNVDFLKYNNKDEKENNNSLNGNINTDSSDNSTDTYNIYLSNIKTRTNNTNISNNTNQTEEKPPIDSIIPMLAIIWIILCIIYMVKYIREI